MDLDGIYQAEFLWTARFLRRCGVPDADLADAVHDTFLVVHRKLHLYDRSRPVRPWIGGIAVRIASERRRRASFRREVQMDAPDQADTAPGALAVAEQREARRHVLTALDALPDDQRAVFVLHELEGQGVPEIAVTMGVKLNTAYSRLRLARQAFTRAIQAVWKKEQNHG